MDRMRLHWFVISLLSVMFLFSPTATVSVAQPACTPTAYDSLGPFYEPNAPERSSTGKGLVLSGTVRSAQGCGALAGARIEWWSTDANGEYDDAYRATQEAGGDGSYKYETVFPGTYPARPPHLHVRVTAPGHRPLVTQIYPEPGQARIQFDFVLGK